MNRREEFYQLLEQLDSVPKELEYTAERAVRRDNDLRRKRRRFGVSAGSFAACFLGFVLLVNCLPTFAYACGGVPGLRDLAKAVAWSPSLSAAVENAYVQPINLQQQENSITATIEYLIVDQKQVNIFYTLDGSYEDLSVDEATFSPEQNTFVSFGARPNAPGTLQCITIDYMDKDVPDGLSLTLNVTSTDGHLYNTPEASVQDALLMNVSAEPEPEALAVFTFDLRFDPEFTADGEIIPVNQTILLNGQTITITEAQVFPTHVRINVADQSENTAWLKGLDFYLENEHGQTFMPISNGISATGSENTDSMVSFRLESTYFARSKHLTLHITGAEWLDKAQETVHIDLAEQTADSLPEGVSLKSAVQKGGGWLLQFRVERRRENHSFEVFYMNYLDAEGQEHEIDRYSSYGDYDSDADTHFIEEFPLTDYPETEVWLKPTYSHITSEKTTITIPLK